MKKLLDVLLKNIVLSYVGSVKFLTFSNNNFINKFIFNMKNGYEIFIIKILNTKKKKKKTKQNKFFLKDKSNIIF